MLKRSLFLSAPPKTVNMAKKTISMVTRVDESDSQTGTYCSILGLWRVLDCELSPGCESMSISKDLSSVYSGAPFIEKR